MKRLFILLILCISCNKSKILNENNANFIKTINNIDDIKKILKHPFLYTWSSILPNIITDEIYINEDFQKNLNLKDYSFYYWNDEFYKKNEDLEDYNFYYSKIFTTNAIIEYLEKNMYKDDEKYYLGLAYFIRSLSYFELSLLHSSFNIHSIQERGVPIRISTNVDEKILQKNLKESFAFIRDDLERSIALITELESDLSLNFINKNWVYAYASRFYLYIGNYESSLYYADKVINENNIELINLNLYTNQNLKSFLQNDIISNINYYNNESSLFNFIISNNTYISPELISKYDSRDKRLVINFVIRNGKYYYRNPYLNNVFAFFCGFTYSELFLNKMECELRLGLNNNYQESADTWIKSRYEAFPYPNEHINTLKFIISEREKEFLLRSVRLMDIKRLYRENIRIDLKKILGTDTFLLNASNPRINILYPNLILKMNENIKQVER